MTIWFASGNAHKKTELAAILSVPLLIPSDAGLNFDPDETGTTFHDNALLKARELYSLLENRRPAPFAPGDIIIADDSGLCVDILGGRPGIFSARYAGKDAPAGNKKLASSERNALLLEELGGNTVRSAPRTARFVCAMALLFSPARFFIAQETFEGEIVKSKADIKGTGGFGYDPIFYIPELGRTAAELTDEEKNSISHRAKAGTIIAEMIRTQL